MVNETCYGCKRTTKLPEGIKKTTKKSLCSVCHHRRWVTRNNYLKELIQNGTYTKQEIKLLLLDKDKRHALFKQMPEEVRWS